MTTYYKVLLHGRSCHGGNAEWALPKQREDGTWEPGDWMPEIQGQLALCINGYHLTSEPALWWRVGAECYEAEWDGEHVGDGGDKIAVRRCRLLRRLTADELASLRVFIDGSHQVSDGVAWAYGSAQVKALGSARVRAHDYAQVEVYDSATVEASGSATVWAFDSAQVWAFDSAQVKASDFARIRAHDYVQVRAYGSAQVKAHDSAQVEVCDSAKVWARGFAQIWAYGSAQVEARDSAFVRTPQSAWGQPTVMTSGAAVWVDYRSDVPVVYTAEGRWEPVASEG